jgi:hypothetical protein
MNTDLARRATVADIVRAYQQSAREVREAYALIDAAEARLSDALRLGSYIGVSIRNRAGRPIERGAIDDVLTSLRRDVWRGVVDRLEIRRILSIAAAAELDKRLDGREVELPEITEENVWAFARGHLVSLDAMLEDAVLEVFEILRPPGSRYKTNTELEIGRRVVLSGVVERWWWGWRVEYSYQQRLRALENVFRHLDGKGAAIPAYSSELQGAIEAAKDGQGVTEYFRFRAYKNRRLHLEFLRPDLVSRLNQIAGGARLKPPRKERAA